MKLHKKHIFIDGCDSVGKTTVCKALGEVLEIPVTHMEKAKEVFSRHKSCDIETLSYMYNHTLAQFKDFSFIVDRGYVSSLVYSIVYQRDPASLKYLEHIEKVLDPTVFILVNRDVSLLKTRGDEVVPVADFEYIQSTYEIVAKNRGYSVIDVTYKSVDNIIKEILSELEVAAYMAELKKHINA